MKSLKILLVWPAFPDEHTKAYVRSQVRFPAEIEVRGPRQHTAKTLETRAEAVYDMPEVMDIIRKGEREGFEAVVLGCILDTGTYEGREFVDIPILGVGEVGMRISSLLGDKFSIITTSLAVKRELEQNVHSYGLDQQLASVRSLNISVMDLVKQYNTYTDKGDAPVIQRIVKESIAAIQEDNASVIMFGCGWMCWTRDEVRSRLLKSAFDVTVFDPLPLTIETARALVNAGITHSRMSYVRSAGAKPAKLVGWSAGQIKKA